jgi:hypothetical protein
MNSTQNGGGSDIAWGAKAIGQVIGRGERPTYRLIPELVKAGVVRKFGAQYVGYKERIRRHVFGVEGK